MQAPILITPPDSGVPLLAIADVRRALLIDHADWDDELTPLVAAATAYLDGWTGRLGRCLITQTWAQPFGRWSQVMRLPFPAQSIASVTYWADEVETTLPPASYRLHTDARGPYLAWVDGAGWPSHDTRDDAIAVTFVAGFGDAATDVPQPIRQAATMLVAHWFRNREAATEAKLEALPLGAQALLAGFTRRTAGAP